MFRRIHENNENHTSFSTCHLDFYNPIQIRRVQTRLSPFLLFVMANEKFTINDTNIQYHETNKQVVN